MLSQNRYNTISFKVSLLVGASTFLLVSLLITYSIFRLRNTEINAATQNAVAFAKDYSGRLKAIIEVPLDGSRAFASGLLATQDPGIPSSITREDVNAMLKNYLEKHPAVLGFYTGWEPNAFDGKDSLYANTNGHDQTGRFVPYWVRNGNQIILEPLVGYETMGAGDYYQIPKNSGQESIIDPYLYSIAGKQVLMMSVVTPIRKEGRFLGITGADLSLGWLQEMVDQDQKNIFGGLGQLAVISHNGTIAAATGRSNLLGNKVDLLFRSFHAMKTTEGYTIQNDTLIASVPLYMGQAKGPWRVCITLPLVEITKTARAEMVKMILISAAFLTVFILVIVLLLKKQMRPIFQISDVARQVASGDLDITQVVTTNLEIEKLNQSFLKVVDSQRDITSVCASIAKGDFSTKAQVKSEKDELAKSVNQMIDHLKLAKEEDQKRNWTAEGLARFAEILRSDKELASLADTILASLVKYVKANQGAFFVTNDSDPKHVQLDMVSCYAYNRKKYREHTIGVGQGLLGQCYLERDLVFLTEVPADYVTITSGLGGATPKCLLIVPLINNGIVEGVIELASFQVFQDFEIAFITKVAESVASTIATSKTNERTKQLLQQSQQQSEELRAQEEEMRQNMEELSATQEEVARRQTEVDDLLAKFDLAAQTTTEGLWDLKVPQNLEITGDTYFWWSDRFRQMVGYRNTTDFPNRLDSWSSLLHEEDKEKTLAAFSAHLMDFTGQTPYNVEYRLKLRTGEYKWFRAVGNTLRDQEGKPIRVAGSLIDIHLTKKLAVQF
jgi:PAS domain-containing protein/HAMP domain-containing protein